MIEVMLHHAMRPLHSKKVVSQARRS